MEHLFVTCTFAWIVWQRYKLLLIYAFRVRDLIDYNCMLAARQKFKKVIPTIWHTVFWCIWRCRNKVVFDHGRCKEVPFLGQGTLQTNEFGLEYLEQFQCI
ncbi:hypothetical protein Hdeb2414_s0009g00311571 [Helianthus debilis subsp. tardiflorus]